MKRRRITVPEVVDFKEGSYTERGERVYATLKIDLIYPNPATTFSKVIQCDKGIGFTEEWIEDTIQGCLKNLATDFPTDVYKVVKVKPNHIRFEYAGPKRVN